MRAARDTLTDFLRHPTTILKKLAKEDVILRRRGDVALRLSLDSRANASAAGTEIAASLLAGMLDLPQFTDSLTGLLATRFPWMTFLPKNEKPAFVREFIETLNACASVGNSGALDEVIAAWKATAAIHSDPKLTADLRRPLPGSPQKARRP